MCHRYKSVQFALFVFLFVLSSTLLFAEPKRSEEQLIQMLDSQNYKDVLDALDRLPNWYPNSTNAVAHIRQILKHDNVSFRRAPATLPAGGRNARQEMIDRVPLALDLGNKIPRKAARALGFYHATLTPDELEILYHFLRGADPDEVMDALKTFRDLRTPEAVPHILPLLKSDDAHILRDSCRTLAAIGDKRALPAIQPLLKNPRQDVKNDAQDAFNTLLSKP